jgi:hypothetical protein
VLEDATLLAPHHLLTADGEADRHVGQTYIDNGDDSVRSAELVFWGEWEPSSRIERRWPTDGRLTRRLPARRPMRR